MNKEKRFLPDLNPEQLAALQLEGLKWTVAHACSGSPAYREKFDQARIKPEDITSLADIEKLPFTTVEDLRRGYPLPLLSVPQEQIVRIHASSGTTGKRKILAYTQKDIDTWKVMMARCFELAGLTTLDRVQIAVGYGLWTAGVGFQLGCEHFGAMAVPLGPGNLDFQLQFLTDLQPACLCSTASMALLLAEQVEKMGLQDRIKLKKLIFGAEPHTPKMRRKIEQTLDLEDSFDIPGMTEVYGPGTGLECWEHKGMHYWADIFILEIVDPVSLKPVQPGQTGEMVITTLRKEGVPLIRYRTRDLTRILPDPCPCGLNLPRHDRILGRSDDMFIFRGVNIYPGQIAEILEGFKDISSEYLITLDRKKGLDFMQISVERKESASADNDSHLAGLISAQIRKKVMVRAEVDIQGPGKLPRSMGKSRRILDQRDQD
ncbi:phenylacetate--CoA ligase family protein [Desulfonatronovibrio hydrogenovorans]|uniref:phenylacetate--CoA ligase family protein n=1 Tax=Desulfonatronovibrio hydrogenovorans TaxID=53245 RepID=UPI00048B38CB|nr:phenylacetate--CoA ligase [Desulfonatronovibrio hydrogenovorans]